VAIIAPSEVQPMMCEIFREIFGQWQVGFIGGRHELQINRVAGGLKTTIPYTVDSRIRIPKGVSGIGPKSNRRSFLQFTILKGAKIAKFGDSYE